MGQLFQSRILKDKVKNQNQEQLTKRWNKLLEYQKEDMINYIKSVKEEKYQDGFLQDIFENCLGYTLDKNNPTNFNLEREKKNTTDSKKADGAISVDGKVVGVVELKGQDTKNFETKGKNVIEQAFGYLVSHDRKYCRYVIVSNFDKLRFYIDDKLNYQEYSLFELTHEQFEELHYLLCYENIKQNIPLELKEQQSSHQEDISNKIYKQYSSLRVQLFNNLVKNNNTIDKNILLVKTQKILDRMIFIFFAEDRDIIPTDTIDKIIEQFKNDYRHDPLYEHYKIYFDAINRGNDRLNISAYNGGLFVQDEVLDSLKIDDSVLQEIPSQLTKYDFNTDIDVNILGHIFENSLNDIEELKASINDENFDKTKTKRKKDGVFYTPEYITKYIVDNTLGKLCDEKKDTLGLSGVDIQVPKNPAKLNKSEQKLEHSLKEYREYLLSLKILDPACGSGAFLNQALNYLLQEHGYIDESEKTLLGGGGLFGEQQFAKTDVKKEVLENNLYGVDINEEAVEIAKLSLWLRTIEAGRPLTKLANKLKVGNSLIDDKSIVPNAFEWEKEFPEVFKNGGFDVVIGNPPYIRVQGLKSNYENESSYYETKYKSAVGKYDIYALFIEKSFHLLNQKGKLSYILPHKFLVADFGKGVREFLSDNKAVESLLHFGSDMVFEDASTYTCILNLSHHNDKLKFKSIKPNEISSPFAYDSISYDKLSKDKWNLKDSNITKVLDKLNEQPLRVKDVFEENTQGIVSGADKIFILEGEIVDQYFEGYSKALNENIRIEKDIVQPIFKAPNIRRYEPLNTNLHIIYAHTLDENLKTKPYEESTLKELFPLTYKYLLTFKNELTSKKIKYKTNPTYWYSLHRARENTLMNKDKLVVPYLSFKSQFNYDKNQNFFSDASYILTKFDEVLEDYKYFMILLNSSLMWFFIKNNSAEFGGGFYYYKTQYTEKFPLPKLNNLEQQKTFIEKADIMLDLNKKLQKTKQTFIKELELEKVSKKVQSFETLEFEEFIKEYKKAKKLKLTKLEERKFKEEWEELFEYDKNKALELQTQINKTDKEIDSMVYELYELSDEEIGIVEGN